MKKTVTILRGEYRGTQIVDKTFPLLKGYRNSSSGRGGYVTVDASSLLGADKTRVRIRLLDESDAVINKEEYHVHVSAPKHETDEEIMERIATRFSILDDMVKSVIAGEIRAMVVSGPPGVGKSYIVEREIEKAAMFDKIAGRKIRAEVVKGSTTAIGLYTTLYKYSDPGSVLVLDDCDAVFADPTSINLLKGSLDTGKKRRISWIADSSLLRREDVPNSFDFNGSVIFITNQNFEYNNSKTLKPHLDALQSRCHVIDLTINTSREKVLRIKQLAKSGELFGDYGLSSSEEDEIIDFIVVNHSKLREISLRTAIKIGALTKAFPNRWKEMASVTCMKSY